MPGSNANRIPWPGPPPVHLQRRPYDGRRNRNHRPLAWQMYERARELWEIEARERGAQDRLTWWRKHAQRDAFKNGLTLWTWYYNEVAWEIIRQHTAASIRLREARDEYRALRARGVQLGEGTGHTARMIRETFPYWFGAPRPSRGTTRLRRTPQPIET